MSRTENTRSRASGFPVETDALAAYLEALMRPVSDVGSCDSIPDQSVFRLPTETFACLPIMVGGMTLAIPGDDVREVLTPLARLADVASSRGLSWFAGYCRTETGQATLVDLAVIIAGRERPAGNLQTAVVIGSKRYALACDAVGDAFDLRPAQVRWRTARTRRPWLAGIETLRRYPLLDIPALERQLIVDEDTLALP